MSRLKEADRLELLQAMMILAKYGFDQLDIITCTDNVLSGRFENDTELIFVEGERIES